MVIARMPIRCICNIMSRIGNALLVVLPDVNDMVFPSARLACAIIGASAFGAVQHGLQPLLDISSPDDPKIASTLRWRAGIAGLTAEASNFGVQSPPALKDADDTDCCCHLGSAPTRARRCRRCARY